MRKRDHNPLTNAASLLICGLLAGVVVAAAAFPAVAMSGLAAKAGAETFDKLPTELTVKKAPQISYLYASDGKTPLATMFDENRRDIPLKDIPQVMRQAIIAAEDHNFYKHNGVDMKGIARAFVNNTSASADQQGASTLTMQYVRMAISYSASSPAEVVAATEDTTSRKLREARFAMQVDKELGKDGVLERYLNIAPFGNGAYGIYAASQVYFGKRPKELKIEEAAMLAGMVKAPDGFDPTHPTKAVKAKNRRDYVIDNMRDIGAITAEQATAAKATELVVKAKRTPNGCIAANKNQWGFFCDYFYRWWLSQETFGATTYDRERRLKSGGYRIVTTLDVKAQDAAFKNVTKEQKIGNKEALMLAAVEPGSGRVRVMAVNRTYRLDNPNKPTNKPNSDPAKRKHGIRGTYPNTTNPLLSGGGDIHGYQAGSVFKIFTMVAALEKGYTLNYTMNAPKQFVSKYKIDPENPAACNGPYYCPTNANEAMAGLHNMWSAFGFSVNTYWVALQQQVGADKAVEVAKRLGIKFTGRPADPNSDAYLAANAEGWGAFTLGVSSTTPLDLANAYATLAADGKYCEPIPVQEIVDQEGHKLDVANPRCNQAVKVEVARAAVDAARCPVGDNSSTSKCGPNRTARNVHGIVDKPVAGKSGTTDSDKTSSLVAMTKQYAFAGVLADPDWPQTTEKMGHDVPGGVNPAVYNSLRDAMKGKPGIEFEPPNSRTIRGDERSIPNVKCQSVDSARSELRDAGFEVEVDRTGAPSDCPAGSVAGTTPERRAPKNSLVTLQISSGSGIPPGTGDQPGTDESPGPGPGRPPGRPGD